MRASSGTPFRPPADSRHPAARPGSRRRRSARADVQRLRQAARPASRSPCAVRRCPPRRPARSRRSGARIGAAVQRMAISGDRALCSRYSRTTQRGCGVLEARRLAALGWISVEERPGGFGGAEAPRSAAQEPGRDRPLQRLGSRSQRHACRLHTGHQAVLGDRHQRGIQHAPLRWLMAARR